MHSAWPYQILPGANHSQVSVRDLTWSRELSSAQPFSLPLLPPITHILNSFPRFVPLPGLRFSSLASATSPSLALFIHIPSSILSRSRALTKSSPEGPPSTAILVTSLRGPDKPTTQASQPAVESTRNLQPPPTSCTIQTFLDSEAEYKHVVVHYHSHASRQRRPLHTKAHGQLPRQLLLRFPVIRCLHSVIGYQGASRPSTKSAEYVPIPR